MDISNLADIEPLRALIAAGIVAVLGLGVLAVLALVAGHVVGKQLEMERDKTADDAEHREPTVNTTQE